MYTYCLQWQHQHQKKNKQTNKQKNKNKNNNNNNNNKKWGGRKIFGGGKKVNKYLCAKCTKNCHFYIEIIEVGLILHTKKYKTCTKNIQILPLSPKLIKFGLILTHLKLFEGGKKIYLRGNSTSFYCHIFFQYK